MSENNFGRFGWLVSDGLFAGSIGRDLTVSNGPQSYSFDDSGKVTVTLRNWTRRALTGGVLLPKNTTVEPTDPWSGEGTVEYTAELTFLPEWKQRELFFAVNKGIDDTDETLFNGSVIGKTGTDTPRYWEHRRLYRIDPAQVRWGETNQFTIRVTNLRDNARFNSVPHLLATLPGAREAEGELRITDIDWVQAHPTVGLDSRILISETVRGVGAIMVNVKGARFVNELTTRDRASDAILHQPERRAWLVFDNDLYKSAKMVRGYDHLGMLKKADTVAELAKLCGMDAKTLEETVKSYNKFKKAGKDEAFGRPDMPLGVEKAPFYAVAVAPGIHHTMGGVAITTESEVLDIQSRPIPGLYAAGEVTGGVHGFNRLGGNAIADTVVFGRRSGEHAAKYALGKK